MDRSSKNQVTRRSVVGSVGLGVVAFAGRGAAAEQGREAMISAKLDNPATAYPKPPFKKQSQSWPGLASEMDPVPDHGEKSYRGSGRLQGRKALITGG